MRWCTGCGRAIVRLQSCHLTVLVWGLGNAACEALFNTKSRFTGRVERFSKFQNNIYDAKMFLGSEAGLELVSRGPNTGPGKTQLTTQIAQNLCGDILTGGSEFLTRIVWFCKWEPKARPCWNPKIDSSSMRVKFGAVCQDNATKILSSLDGKLCFLWACIGATGNDFKASF